MEPPSPIQSDQPGDGLQNFSCKDPSRPRTYTSTFPLLWSYTTAGSLVTEPPSPTHPGQLDDGLQNFLPQGAVGACHVHLDVSTTRCAGSLSATAVTTSISSR